LNAKEDKFILENFKKEYGHLPPPNTGITKIRIHEVQDGRRRLELVHIHDESHLADESLRSGFPMRK
jgi:hypothetical protein